MPEHLLLNQRKALVPRLCLAESLLHFGEELHVRRRTGPVRLLQTLVDADTRAELDAQRTRDAEPLDVTVRETARRHRDYIGQQFTREEPPLVDRFLDDYVEAAGRISCSDCAGNEICTGGTRDDEIVARRGRCLDPLLELFEIAKEAAVALYSHYLPELDAPALELSTAYYAEAPHRLHVPVYVGGRIRRRQTSFGRVAEVGLLVTVSGFDLRSYLSTLYVLLHECVVHAFEGLTRPARDDDAFAEGWMDLVALEVLERITRGIEPVRALAGRLQKPDYHLREGSSLSAERARLDLERTESGYVVRGRSAAYQVQRLLPRLPGLHEPEDAFLRLSLDLNVQPADHALRYEFVEALAGGLEPTATAPELPALLTRPFAAYFAGELDAGGLLREVSARV